MNRILLFTDEKACEKCRKLREHLRLRGLDGKVVWYDLATVEGTAKCAFYEALNDAKVGLPVMLDITEAGGEVTVRGKIVGRWLEIARYIEREFDTIALA